MPNFTFQIKEAKLFEVGGKLGKTWGKILWTDGTCEFEDQFETINPQAIDVIANNRAMEINFRVVGTMTVNIVYKDGPHKGRKFNKLLITEIEVI